MENFEIINTQKTKSIAANAMTYGIMVGFAMIVYSVILYAFDLSMNKALSWVSYILLITAMYIGSTKYRTSYTDTGYLPYGKAFLSNFLIGLFASILMLIWTYIFLKFIDKGMINQILEKTQEGMLESNPNMTQEQMDMAMKYTKIFMRPEIMAIVGLLSTAFFSVILSLIIAFFVKKEEPIVL
ncbi:MAG: DUF4199 domain-containing protein [Bacteroidetes bacterium]|nr:DUF4199 domain-containing protein [Bacteroidota bacterium]